MTSGRVPFNSIARGFKYYTKPGTGDKKPKHTLTELAAELGVCKDTLRKRMQRSTIPAPKPALESAKGLWYEPVEFLAWHKAYLKSLDDSA